MNPHLRSGLIAFACMAMLHAGDALPPEASAPPATGVQQLAEAAAAQGRAALRLYRTGPMRSPEVLATAVAALSEAHTLYLQADDRDGVVEMDTCLAWCRRQAVRQTVAPGTVVPPPQTPGVPEKATPATRFSKRAAETNKGGPPMPDEKALRQQIAEVKKIYARQYARKTDVQKRQLAEMLTAEAEKSSGDPIAHCALLTEAMRLAQESENYLCLLDAIDALAARYRDVDAGAQKRSWLKRFGGKPVAGAITTLLDSPRDPDANSVAGKFFCYQLGRWGDGLPMLAQGGDTVFKAVATQELARPSTDSQRVLLGDAWAALARNAGPAADRLAALRRARYWYEAARRLDGMARQRVADQIIEIDKVLPLDLDTLDWSRLTPVQWDKLKAPLVLVPLRVHRTGPVATLQPGRRMRIVPHPSDGDGPQNDLLVAVDKGPPQPCGVVAGPGNVWMISAYAEGDNRAQIRIKLVAIDDD